MAPDSMLPPSMRRDRVGFGFGNPIHAVEHVVDSAVGDVNRVVCSASRKAFGNKAGNIACEVFGVLTSLFGPKADEAFVDVLVGLVKAVGRTATDAGHGNLMGAALDLVGGISGVVFLAPPFGPLLEHLFFEGNPHLSPDQAHAAWLKVNDDIGRRDPMFALRVATSVLPLAAGGLSPSGIVGLIQAVRPAVGILVGDLAHERDARVDPVRLAATVDIVLDVVCGLILDISEIGDAVAKFKKKGKLNLTPQQELSLTMLLTQVVGAFSSGHIGAAMASLQAFASLLEAIASVK